MYYLKYIFLHSDLANLKQTHLMKENVYFFPLTLFLLQLNQLIIFCSQNQNTQISPHSP